MPVTPSPLRYPGGKTNLYELTRQLLADNGLRRCTYAEPYAGGAGLALRLLFEGDVRRIVLNDLDPGIYSFWNAVLTEPERLIDTMLATPISVDEWLRQRQTHRDAVGPSFDLGFATFFLNRTNRSGIVKGGVIGGLDQTGTHKLDCRFNIDSLTDKIRRIARYAGDIELRSQDGATFLEALDERPRILFFIDPPYYLRGSGLYTNFYTPADHAQLAAKVTALSSPWILTYDNVPQIADLYDGRTRNTFDLNYSVGTKRVGTELMVTSDHFVDLVSPRLRPLDRELEPV